jgi:hypothetical protein
MECGKEFYVIYFDRHIKNCKHTNKKDQKEKVSCPICGKRLKEVNTAHLREHGLEYDQVKLMFPDYKFISEDALSKKATLLNLTPEQSRNLRFGHTLEARIQKYGEEEGTKRHLKARESYSFSKTLAGYIDRLGVEEGTKLWNQKIEKITQTLLKFNCELPPEERVRGTLQWYQEKYGKELGEEKWMIMCNNKSKSLRKIPIELAAEYSLYKFLVNRVTKINVKLYGKDFLFLESRGRKMHLDHMYSIYQGFIDGVSPYVVGFIENLTLLSAKENCSKQFKCSQSLDKLMTKIKENVEYQNTMNLDLFEVNADFEHILL